MVRVVLPNNDEPGLLQPTTNLYVEPVLLTTQVNTYYSVMQTDGNSLAGDVVLDSINIAYRSEDNILYQI